MQSVKYYKHLLKVISIALILFLFQSKLQASAVLFDPTEGQSILAKVLTNHQDQEAINQMILLFHGPGAAIWKETSSTEEVLATTITSYPHIFKDQAPTEHFLAHSKEQLLDSRPFSERHFLNSFFQNSLCLESISPTEKAQLSILTLPMTVTDLITIHDFDGHKLEEVPIPYVRQCMAINGHLKGTQHRFKSLPIVPSFMPTTEDISTESLKQFSRIMALDVLQAICKGRKYQDVFRPELKVILKGTDVGAESELPEEQVITLLNSCSHSTILNTIDTEVTDILANRCRIWRTIKAGVSVNVGTPILAPDEQEMYDRIRAQYKLNPYTLREYIVNNHKFYSDSLPENSPDYKCIIGFLDRLKDNHIHALANGRCILDFPIPMSGVYKAEQLVDPSDESIGQLLYTISSYGNSGPESIKDLSYGYSLLAGLMFDGHVAKGTIAESTGACVYTRLLYKTESDAIDLIDTSNLLCIPTICYSIGMNKSELPEINRLLKLPLIPLHQGVLGIGEDFHPRTKLLLDGLSEIVPGFLGNAFQEAVKCSTRNILSRRRTDLRENPLTEFVQEHIKEQLRNGIPCLQHAFLLTDLLNRAEIVNYAGCVMGATAETDIHPLSGKTYAAIASEIICHHQRLGKSFKDLITS